MGQECSVLFFHMSHSVLSQVNPFHFVRSNVPEINILLQHKFDTGHPFTHHNNTKNHTLITLKYFNFIWDWNFCGIEYSYIYHQLD
jgi:hypothetical protein